MAERDLDAMLRRMSQTKVNRRSFLGAAGLTGAAAALAACSGGGTTSAAPSAAAPSAAASAGASAAPVASASAAAAGTARKRTAHVQLEPVHRPGQHRRLQGRVRGRHVPVRRLRQQRGAAREAQGRRGRLRHRLADRRVPARHGRGGLHPEARRQPDPEPQVHQREVQGALVGPDRRVPRPEGLRDDRHPVPRQDRPEPAPDVGRLLRPTSRARDRARRSSSTRWAT